MTDLHTHILPGMDDGAKDPAAARRLLEQQARQGVDRIALTSHFHCEAEDLVTYLWRREASYGVLASVCPEGLHLKRGCEVFFSPQLLRIEPERLCLEGTRVLLLELPVLQKPAFLREVLIGLRERGIVPLIAHVERYAYVVQDPAILASWISLGALIQVNAESLTGPRSFAMRLVKWGLVHVIASDAHSVKYRPPNLRRGLDAVAKAAGAEAARALERNAGRIFAGKQVPAQRYHVPRRVLGFWL